MKKCLLLSLLCVFVTHITLAKVGMPCDNTHVLKNQKFLQPSASTKKSASFLTPFSPQHFPAPASTALTSTTVLKDEIEPNNVVATADSLKGNDVKVKGYITPNSDVDVFLFTANAGDRVYTATQTSFSATGSSDSFLEIIRSNGTTILESDDNDGSFGTNASGIAGAIIPTTGTYYIRIRHISNNVTLLPYFLYFRLQTGTPLAEVEPNNSTSTANPIPDSGWVSGNLSSGQEADYYSIALNAGETIFVSLDFDPERDNTTWNGQIAFGEFTNFYIGANDGNTTSPNSESFFLTVKSSGTFYIVVAPSDFTFGTYRMSVSILPPKMANMTTYTNNTVLPLSADPGSYTSTINVPANKRIESIKVSMNIFHGNIADLDVRLTSPSGNTVILFTDITASSPFDIKLDDNAAVPLGSFPIASNMVFQPPYKYRLEWFKGQPAQGDWTLTIDDDSPGNGGQLNSWAIEIEEQLPITGTLTNIYSNDFETNDGGFTHSGTQDEWERGTPSFAPITTANSGTKCWKTDLDNTYNYNANVDLVSPNIYIPDVGTNSVYLIWAQKFQFAGADTDNDNAYVEIQEVGNANTKRIWQWFGASMVDNFYGSPNYTVHESAGWALQRVNVSEFAGKTIRIVFHFDSNGEGSNLAGWAIDDVAIFKTFCPATETLSANYTGVYSRFVASTIVTATNQLTTDIGLESPANITYQGGNAVVLLPNFKADASGGTVFMAQIGGCN
jgi:subtilisin-like proprotein convertase family protein